MRKSTLILLAAIAGLGTAATALPASAASYSCDNDSINISQDANNIQRQLEQKGIDATNVSDWNGCVQAFVTNADGKTTIQYFNPYTLEPAKSAVQNL